MVPSTTNTSPTKHPAVLERRAGPRHRRIPLSHPHRGSSRETLARLRRLLDEVVRPVLLVNSASRRMSPALRTSSNFAAISRVSPIECCPPVLRLDGQIGPLGAAGQVTYRRCPGVSCGRLGRLRSRITCQRIAGSESSNQSITVMSAGAGAALAGPGRRPASGPQDLRRGDPLHRGGRGAAPNSRADLRSVNQSQPKEMDPRDPSGAAIVHRDATPSRTGTCRYRKSAVNPVAQMTVEIPLVSRSRTSGDRTEAGSGCGASAASGSTGGGVARLADAALDQGVELSGDPIAHRDVCPERLIERESGAIDVHRATEQHDTALGERLEAHGMAEPPDTGDLRDRHGHHPWIRQLLRGRVVEPVLGEPLERVAAALSPSKAPDRARAQVDPSTRRNEVFRDLDARLCAPNNEDRAVREVRRGAVVGSVELIGPTSAAPPPTPGVVACPVRPMPR